MRRERHQINTHVFYVAIQKLEGLDGICMKQRIEIRI